MKIILSRKGFDSSAGGTASPIFSDGRLQSIPIPHPLARTLYSNLSVPDTGLNLGTLVEDLTDRRVRSRQRAHLDPDLHAGTQPRPRGWRPMFGQAGAAQSHLHRQGVGRGDLFLFFGWFREVECRLGHFRYARNAPDHHVLFGWLHVRDVIPAYRPGFIPVWARDHPHFIADLGRRSTVYVSSSRDDDKPRRGDLGAGIFPQVRDDLTLTWPGRSRSNWRLPAWFAPRAGRSSLTYHPKVECWRIEERACALRTTGRGQEFVLDTNHFPEALPWARELIRGAGDSTVGTHA